MAEFSSDKSAELKKVFFQFNTDRNSHLKVSDLDLLMKQMGEVIPGYNLRQMVKEVKLDEEGTFSFDEFLEMYKKVQLRNMKIGLVGKVKKAKELLGNIDELATSSYFFSDDEKVAIVQWVNLQLVGDPDVSPIIPMSEEGDAVYKSLHNGIVLCKLINKSVPNTVDERAINKGNLSKAEMEQNLRLALGSASSIGCNIVDIGPQDIIDGCPYYILGLLWQIIKFGLFDKISIHYCPDLTVLLNKVEGLPDLFALSPQQTLLRWFNYHLEQAGSSRRVRNFGQDINDSECYTILLNQIANSIRGVNMSPMEEDDLEIRAAKMLTESHKLLCRRFVRPKDVVKGNQRLNMAFVANLFVSYPALRAHEDTLRHKIDPLDIMEEKSYCRWLNAVGVSSYVHSLFYDLKDGVALIEVFDKIKPGSVNWEQVNKPPFKKMSGKMKKLDNCFYVTELARQQGFRLDFVNARNLVSGNRTAILSIVWQVVRAYTLTVLQKVAKSDKPISEGDIIVWVNTTLKAAGKATRLSSFKDATIATNSLVLDLVDSIKPGLVNFRHILHFVQDPKTRLKNASYAISMSRKIGARVYTLPEDLVEPNPRMCFIIFACLMAGAKAMETQATPKKAVSPAKETDV